MSPVRYNVPAYMRQSPLITDFGKIADPAGFSQRTPDYKPYNTTIPLKPVSGRLRLDAVPSNFHATIRMAEDIHYADTQDQPNCALQIFQGTLQPGRNFGVIEPHIDSIINSYPDNTGVLEDSFIISDALPTIFYRQAFDLPDHVFAKQEDFYWRLSEIFKSQVKPENRFIPEPYHLVRFNALTVHESQLAAVPTDRTVAVMHFY
jgi:hypothetical protein